METASRMPNMPSREDMARLRSLVPLHTLPDDALSELLADAGFEKLGKGKMLFEQGAIVREYHGKDGGWELELALKRREYERLRKHEPVIAQRWQMPVETVSKAG